MGQLGNVSAVTAIAGLMAAQVILPATIDLLLTIAIAAVAAWAGRQSATQ